MYKFKQGVKLPYVLQGLIHFYSRSYQYLPAKEKEMIRQHCETQGGEHARALFEYVTTDSTPTSICLRFYLGKSTLYRIVRKYYENFPLPYAWQKLLK